MGTPWSWSYGLRDTTCYMGSHSVTCHPTQVNVPCLTPATGWYSIYLPRRDGRLSWPSWLDSAPAESRTSDLLITSPMPKGVSLSQLLNIFYIVDLEMGTLMHYPALVSVCFDLHWTIAPRPKGCGVMHTSCPTRILSQFLKWVSFCMNGHVWWNQAY